MYFHKRLSYRLLCNLCSNMFDHLYIMSVFLFLSSALAYVTWKNVLASSVVK